MAELTPGDTLTADAVTTDAVQALLDYLYWSNLRGQNYVATRDVRAILAGGEPSWP